MKILNWGLVPYEEATKRQLELVEQLASTSVEKSQDFLVFCSHPPVVTVGRGTKPQDIFGWQGDIVETSRGGRATYHGPSQIVAYPILNLQRAGRKNFAERDLHGYMRALERSIVETLRELGIESEARSVKVDADSPSLTGVWIGDKKVASIGIAVKKWITYHGLALNVTDDPLAFTGINPCGFRTEIMTSIEGAWHLLVSQPRYNGGKLDKGDVQKVLAGFLTKYLG